MNYGGVPVPFSMGDSDPVIGFTHTHVENDLILEGSLKIFLTFIIFSNGLIHWKDKILYIPAIWMCPVIHSD